MLNALRPLLAVLFVGVVAGAAGAASADDCTSVLRNHSNGTWSVEMIEEHISGRLVNVQGGARCRFRSGNSFACVIPPQGEATFAWAMDHGGLSGSYHVTDEQNVMRSFAFTGGSCAYIEHDGDTGAVSMNEPSDGDMSFDGDSW